jgi:hypothetical protein
MAEDKPPQVVPCEVVDGTMTIRFAVNSRRQVTLLGSHGFKRYVGDLQPGEFIRITPQPTTKPTRFELPVTMVEVMEDDGEAG